MYAFDFFCGAGGLTRGLLNAGIRVVAGFDCDGKSKKTYEFNNPQAEFVELNVRNIFLSDLKKYARGKPFEKMLFAGCAPCQPFSKQLKRDSKRRNATLLSEFGRLINLARPGYVLMENVPGIAKVKGYSTFRRFIRLLETNGYQYEYKILNAKKYGVPQNRARLFLIAIRGKKPSFPEPLYGPGLLPYKTVRDAISHFPEIKAGEKHKKIRNHVSASISTLNLLRLLHTPHDGGDRRSWPKHLLLQCHKGKHEGHTDVYGRMSWDSPAPTLTSRCNSLSNGRYGHPSQSRAISLREAAALQTFPGEYLFYGSNNHVALQIGNAVPVKLGKILGKQILISRAGNGSASSIR